MTPELTNNLSPGTTDLPGILRNIYLANSRGILIICGETLRIRDANPAALALLQTLPQHVIDKALSEVSVFRTIAGLDRVLAELPDTRTAVFEEVPVSARTGGTDFIDITLQHYLVSNRTLIECSFQVVTARKRRHLRERRQHTMTALTHMADYLARELNGLLPVMGASSDLALGPGALVQPSYKAIEEVQKARERLALLARGLSAFSGSQTLELQPVDVNQLLAGMDMRLCQTLGEQVRMSQHLTPELPPAKADLSRLQSVILTLAAFARRRMPQGGSFAVSSGIVEAGDPVLRDLGAVPGRYLRLTLQDDGETLDGRAWMHLFEPFDGGDDNGLAMAAAYGIVKQFGGYLSARGGEPGMTFHIYLPAVQTYSPEQALQAPAAAASIVLFEPEEGLRKLIRNLLARKGYRILEAAEQDEVRRIFASEASGSLDLLIANVESANLAFDMALKHSHLKLIYISEFTDDTAEQRPGPLPADAPVLQKPFRLDTLLVKIRGVLDNKPSAR